jgi:hypothetical protein
LKIGHRDYRNQDDLDGALDNSEYRGLMDCALGKTGDGHLVMPAIGRAGLIKDRMYVINYVIKITQGNTGKSFRRKQ